MEDVTQLPDVMLPNTKRVVGDIQKNLGERSKTYAASALIVQEELNLVIIKIKILKRQLVN